MAADVETSNWSDRTRAFVYDLGAPTLGWRDLGTLGGPASSAAAVDGTTVVGDADTPTAHHAFAYDLGSPTAKVQDIGTLGGRYSEAHDVSGSVVVGSASTRTEATHAFVYDLSAPSPTMRDLGTLGGANSSASAVSGQFVVGSSSTSTGATHAFAYDLAAATPHMRDLGTLGGTYSSAYDVAGTIVVGGASPSGGESNSHAFAYDLGAVAPTMQDLGRIRNTPTAASEVSGNVVIGDAWIDRTTTAGFVYHLGAATPRMHVISLGGASSLATGVDGNIVVGWAERAGDNAARFYAYDLDQPEPQMSDLGPADEDYALGPVISGNLMASSRLVGERLHGTAWTLSRTTMPALRLDRIQTGAQENVGRVMVTVNRGGDPGPAVAVPYSTRNHLAIAGKDYTATSGILAFAPGQTSGSFSVPIRNDAASEWPEEFTVLLGQPSVGAIRGAPNMASIEILASDQRPDGWISTRSSTGYIGNNIYNANGARQTKTLTSHRTQTRNFYVRVYNDGNNRNTITLTGSQARPGSGVRYYLGKRDVTTTMRAPSGVRLHLEQHSHRQLVMRIQTRSTASVGALLPGSVKATWVGDGVRSDLVKGVVRVIR